MGFERVPCNFCGSMIHEVLFKIRESPDERQPPAWRGTAYIPVVRCANCGLVFLNPRYDDARLTALYQDPQMFTRTIDPEGRTRSLIAERVERVARFRPDVAALRQIRESGRLLDVGCGPGFFLEALNGGYDAVGLEWSAPAIEIARGNLPNPIMEARFPSHLFRDGEFDILVFNNTLDHLTDPLLSLQTARKLLRPDGLLMLTLVNFASLASRLYGAGFRLLGANHLYYFTPTTLFAYLKKAGFQLVKITYPYFGADYSRPLEHATRVLADWWGLNVLRKRENRLSPPFYGNMMRVFAVCS